MPISFSSVWSELLDPLFVPQNITFLNGRWAPLDGRHEVLLRHRLLDVVLAQLPDLVRTLVLDHPPHRHLLQQSNSLSTNQKKLDRLINYKFSFLNGLALRNNSLLKLIPRLRLGTRPWRLRRSSCSRVPRSCPSRPRRPEEFLSEPEWGVIFEIPVREASWNSIVLFVRKNV